MALETTAVPKEVHARVIWNMHTYHCGYGCSATLFLSSTDVARAGGRKPRIDFEQGLENSVVPLSMIESAVLVLADQPTSFASVAARLKAMSPVEETRRVANSLPEWGLLLCHDPSLLTIVPFSVPVETRKLGEWLECSLGIQTEAGGKPFKVIAM